MNKKLLKIFLPIFILLLIIRLVLPSVVLAYVTKRINQIPGYHVKIASINMSIFRGSYTLNDIALTKAQSNVPVPFFAAKALDFSLEWHALLHASIVAKIIAYQPEVNFVIDPQGKDEQLTIDKKWQNIVKSLYPLNINSLEIENGKITLQSFKGHPPFKIMLHDVSSSLSNMQNANNLDKQLASSFVVKAHATGHGKLFIKGGFDPFSKAPTFDLEGSIKKIQIKDSNDFLHHFTKIDVENGELSVFVEAAAANGKITGYAKPFVKDLKVVDPNKHMEPLEALYKGALELVAKVVTNPKTETVATKVKLTGRVDDPDTSTLSIIGYLLRHAFINALLPQIDHNVKLQDVNYKSS